MSAPSSKLANIASQRRRRLLSGVSALFGASLLQVATAHGQTLPPVPAAANITFTTGGAQPTILKGANSLDVTLQATRTVINWGSFHVSGLDTATFQFAQSTDIVLNKSPTAIQIDAGGKVRGLVGGAAGGNIWFYSPQGVVISPGADMTAGNFVFSRGSALVDLDFVVQASDPLVVLRTASDALLQITTITSATTASINATGDLVLSASSGDVVATTALAAGAATVTASAGSVTVGEVTATNGVATVTATGGSVSLGSLNGQAGASAVASSNVSVLTATAGSGTGDIVLTAGAAASLGTGSAGRDIKVVGPAASLGAATAGRDVYVTATTGNAVVTGAVNAGDDIEVTATTGSVNASPASLTASGAGAVDDAHVLVRSTGGSVAVGSAITQGAGPTRGDVTVQAALSASLGSGASTRDIKVSGVSASLGGASTAAGDVFVTATTGAATVTGLVTAGDDIEITATTGSVAATGATLTSTGTGATDDAHVLLRSTGGLVAAGSATTQGTSVAAGDVVLEGATSASLTSGASSRDIRVSGPTASLGAGAAARDVFVAATTGAAIVTGAVTAGDDIEVTSTTGSVSATAASLSSTGVGATDDAHVLVRALNGSVALGSASTQGTGPALGDVSLQAATTASLGTGSSSGSLSILGQAASLGDANVAGDVIVTATTGNAVVTGVVTAGDDIEVTATAGAVLATTASLTSTGIGATDDAHVLARSSGSSVSVGTARTQGTGNARGDVTVEAASTASLTSGSSTRDIRTVAISATLGSGDAAGDVFVTATTGNAAVTGVVVAGDDIEVTATTGSVTAGTAILKSTGVGAGDDAHVLVRSTSGSVVLGSARTEGVDASAGDVVVDGATSASLSSGVSSRDVRVVGPEASLGAATAAGDVFVTATTGVASVTGDVTAGDDIEITTASGSVAAAGANLVSTGAGASDDAHVLVRSGGGSITVGSVATQGTGAALGDVTLEATATVTLTGTATASRDLQLLAGDTVTAGGSIASAGRDLVARANSGNVAVGTARADDDIVLRALSGSVTATGDLQAGRTQATGDPDVSGAADALLGVTMVGHDLDIKAQTIAVAGHVAAGRAPDENEMLGAAQLASDVLAVATNADPSPGVAALRLATAPGKQVTAHQDINIYTESPAGASLSAGALFAGRDVAVYSPSANITLGSAQAGDDVVLRAPKGAIHVAGDVKAGRDTPGMTALDANGAADDLNAALPFLDFDSNPATIFSVVGFDVSVVSQSVTLLGSTIAGRQPSTDNPDAVGGAVDTTTSDVRIGARLSPTPVTGLAPNIVLGSVTATRDLQIDSAKAVTAGDLSAGRDIAVLGRGGVTPGDPPGDHTGAGVTLGSARAGDDALVFSIYGRTRILGAVKSGQPFLRLAPTDNKIIDGATEAADQLAIYLHYFDLDDASAPYVLTGGDVLLAGVGVEVGGALSAQGAGSDVRLRSSSDILVLGDTTSSGYAVFQADAAGGGSVTTGAVLAALEVSLDGAGVTATGTLTSSGGDVAIRSRGVGNAISLAGVSASDDVVVRGLGHVAISGPVSAGGGANMEGLGDALRTLEGSVVLEGQTFDLTGGDIDIRAASVTTTGAMTASGGASDVRVQSAGVISLGAANAGRDVLVDGGDTVLTGMLTAGRDVGVRSLGVGSAVTVGGASAGDDVVIRANGAITITGTLSAGGGADSAAPDQAGDLMFGVAKSSLDGDLDLVGGTVDVRSSAGSVTVTGATTAATDARFQTAGTTASQVTTGAVTAVRNVLLDGAGVTATGTLTSSGGDVAIRSRGVGNAISLAGVSASDDVVVRGLGHVAISGPVSAGGGANVEGLGDALRTLEGSVVLEGQTFDLTGGDIDIRAASVTTTGAMTASGGASDVRVQSAGVISLGAANAGRDVLVDGGDTVLTGMLTAGRDVGVRSLGVGSAVTVGGASAGDDVVIRANGAITITGTLSAGGGADSAAPDQAGDLMFGVAKSSLDGDLDLVGGTVDVRSSAGSVTVTGATTAATDARFQTAGTTASQVTTGAVTAVRNVLLDGAGVTATGTLTSSGGDVAIRSRGVGNAISLAGVSASDDVVVRGLGHVAISGPVSAGGGANLEGLGDALRTLEGSVVLEGQTFDLTGGDIDIRAASVTTTGAMTASGGASDVRVQSAGVISLGAANAGRDVLVDGGDTVLTGMLTAGRDVGVRSLGVGSAVTVGGASAGDDVVIRANGAITITGTLSAGGGADSAAPDQAGDLMFGVAKSRLAGDLDLAGRTVDVLSTGGSILVGGATTAATDARFQTILGGGSVKVAAVSAGRGVLLDGGAGAGVYGVEATGDLVATDGDVAIRARAGKAISLAGLSAGDDVALRATGGIRATGVVSTTGKASTLGLADRLVDGSEAGALSVGGLSFDLAGSDIDIIGDAVNIFRTDAFGSLRVKAGSASVAGGATVGVDILIDSGSSLTVGDLSAAGDIALRSRNGSLAVGRLVAGDDIVLRAAQGISAVFLKAGGIERLGVGDQMFASDPIRQGEALGLSGNTIDLRTVGGPIALGSAEASGDVRLQSDTGDVSASGMVMAGRDILADGGSVTMSGALTASGDVALYARNGRVSAASITAGDDIVIRATGDVTTSGVLKSGAGPDSLGTGDRLITAVGALALAENQAEVGRGVIDIRGASLALQGSLFAEGSDGRVQLESVSGTTVADVTAAGDLQIDAGGDVVTGVLTAGGDIGLRSMGGAISIGSAAAGDDIVVRSAGSIKATGPLIAQGTRDVDGVGDRMSALNRLSLNGDFDLLGQNIDIKSNSGAITTSGRLKASGDVRLQASSGRITTAEVVADRDVLLDGASIKAGALQAGRDIAVRAQAGAVDLGSARAGDDLIIRAAGAITVAESASATGGVGGEGVADRLFAIDRSSLGGDFDLAGSSIDLKSTSGDIALSGKLSAVDDIRLFAASGAVRTADLSAGRDVLIDTGAGAVEGGALEAGRDIAVRAGSIALQSAAAGDDLVLRATGDIRVAGRASARGSADGDGAGDRLYATDRTGLNGDLSLTGANVDVRSRGAITMSGAVAAGQDARFQTVGAGDIRLAEVTAGSDILADGRSVEATGQLTAGRDVALRGRAGGVTVAAISAGDDIAIRATGSVRATGALLSGSAPTSNGVADRLIAAGESGMIFRLVDPMAANAVIDGFTLGAGDIDIRSGEAISLGGALTAAGASNIRLQAGTRLSLAGATAGESIFTRSRDLSLNGAWRATTARIEVTAAGGLALGEGVTAPADGLALSSLQIGLIDAAQLQVFVGDSSGTLRGSALSIGAFAVDTAKIKTSLELYAGPSVDVRVTGAFAPLSGAANATNVRIGATTAGAVGWTPSSIRVIANNGGSIGASATTGGRIFTDVRAFATVELNARGDILMGYQDFIDKLSATAAASVPNAVKSLIAPQTALGPRMLITAGALTLRADGKVAQQDTGGLTGLTPTGIYLLGAAPGKPQLLLGRTSTPAAGGSALPEYIELNGALTNGAIVITGQSVSLSSAIAFEGGVSPSQFYRMNTCAILQQGSCTPATGQSNISIAPDQLTGLTLEDRTAAAGTADPTVASATNEEAWKDPD